MTWKASPPAIEIAAAWTAAICLGGAAGFAIVRIAPLGAGMVEAGVIGGLTALAGWAIIGRVDRQRGQSVVGIAPPQVEFVAAIALLSDPPVEDEVLSLDDPIEAEDNPRVVRLFAEQPPGAPATPVPFAGPGEMAERIERFLGQPRSDAARVGPAAAQDASAALHNALADIRRSLSQG